MNRNMLERIQKLRGVETVLGLRFGTKPEYTAQLPHGSRSFAAAGRFLLCFVEGYQETVFAADLRCGIIKPIAYDVTELLRLILACGSAEQVVCMAMHCRPSSQENIKRHPYAVQRIRELLSAEPISDPAAYLHTVDTVIDCRGLKSKLCG